MRFRLRPLTLALALAGISAQASATDLVQAYDLARNSDPQFASAEALRKAQQEGVVQSRAALLPQVSADVTFNHSEISSSGSQVFNGVTSGVNSSSNESSRRGSGVNVQQSVFDFGNYTRLGASKSRALQADAELAAADDALVVRVADAYLNVLTQIETLASARARRTGLLSSAIATQSSTLLVSLISGRKSAARPRRLDSFWPVISASAS
jgi:outer membrane protein